MAANITAYFTGFSFANQVHYHVATEMDDHFFKTMKKFITLLLPVTADALAGAAAAEGSAMTSAANHQGSLPATAGTGPTAPIN